MEKTRVFKIKDLLEKKNYLFVGNFEEIESIITKISNFHVLGRPIYKSNK